MPFLTCNRSQLCRQALRRPAIHFISLFDNSKRFAKWLIILSVLIINMANAQPPSEQKYQEGLRTIVVQKINQLLKDAQPWHMPPLPDPA